MNRRPLCIAPGCYSRGQHKDDCEGGECRGCVPRVAASDSRLCEGCIQRLARNIAELPDLHEALADAMAGGSGDGERSSNKPGSKVPNPGAMDARHAIRAHLVAWALVVIEDRGVSTPADTIAALAAFLRGHVGWIGEQLYADEAVSQFAEVAGKARSIAYPSGNRPIKVGKCVTCGGILKARIKGKESEVTCEDDVTHRWDATQWKRLGHQLKAAA